MNGLPIDWRSVARGGSSFAFVKATEGTAYVNPWFASDWAAIRAAGLIRGAYDYARPSLPVTSAAAQAVAFVNAVGTTREQGDLPPVLDLETTGGLGAADLVSWTRIWLGTVGALTGRGPMIYTGQYFWREATGNSTAFTGYPLWIASYANTAPAAPLAGGWRGWALWQHTSDASIPGISGGVDRSVFCCSARSLASFADGRTAAITARYLALGGLGSFLGSPLGPERATPAGWAQPYRGGVIYWSPASGAHEVHGAILTRYLADGGPGGVLGYPTTDEQTVKGAHVSSFTGGRVYQTPRYGAHSVRAAILTRWLQLGGPTGADGPPVSEPTTLGQGTGQPFAGGRFYWAATTGAHEVHGPILARYLQVDGPAGPLGFPTTDQTPQIGGAQSLFQAGVIRYLDAVRAALVG